jgi:hypothetical protein
MSQSSVKMHAARHFLSPAMSDAGYEWVGQIQHLPVKPGVEIKQRQLSQQERLAEPVRLKFSSLIPRHCLI